MSQHKNFTQNNFSSPEKSKVNHSQILSEINSNSTSSHSSTRHSFDKDISSFSEDKIDSVKKDEQLNELSDLSCIEKGDEFSSPRNSPIEISSFSFSYSSSSDRKLTVNEKNLIVPKPFSLKEKKVTFAKDDKLVEIVNIESFKKFNQKLRVVQVQVEQNQIENEDEEDESDEDETTCCKKGCFIY